MTEDLDPRLAAALATWREEAGATPDPAAVDAALLAMRSEVLTQSPARSWSMSAWRLRVAVALAGVRAHPRLVAATVAPLAVVSLTAAGWSSPAGAPLHFIEVSRERTQLALPGADRANLELSFAERRLHDATQGDGATADSLREADGLLSEARRDLPPNPPPQLTGRLQADVEQLQKEAQTTVGPGPTPTPAPSLAPSGVPESCARVTPSNVAGAAATPRLMSPCAASPSASATLTPPTGRPSASP